MSSKTYDILKFIALIVLPAVGTLYFALAQIWGLPYGEEIVGTITAIDAFLGAILGVSTSSYKKGIIEGGYRDWETDRKSTRLNSSHRSLSRMPSSA